MVRGGLYLCGSSGKKFARNPFFKGSISRKFYPLQAAHIFFMSSVDAAGAVEAGTRRKFPRITHVVNGPLKGTGVGRDDLMYTPAEASAFLHPTPGRELLGGAYDHAHDVEGLLLTVEEKIDGANTGIYLDNDGGTLCCQNRSHFVNELTAPQWKGLQGFLDQNKADLLNLFYSIADHPKVAPLLAGKPPVAAAEGNPAIPATQWILYGEWTVARHTVGYNALPSPFLAFDLYSCVLDEFLSTSLRNELLAEYCPSIAVVPQIFQKPLLEWLTASVPAGGYHHHHHASAAAAPRPVDEASMLALWKTLGRGHQEDAIAAAWTAIHGTWFKQPAAFAGVEYTHEKPAKKIEGEGEAETAAKGHKGKPTSAKPPAVDTPKIPFGTCEGGIIRIESRTFLQRRCKGVHDDFRQAIDNDGHWTSHNLVKNRFAVAGE